MAVVHIVMTEHTLLGLQDVVHYRLQRNHWSHMRMLVTHVTFKAIVDIQCIVAC